MASFVCGSILNNIVNVKRKYIRHVYVYIERNVHGFGCVCDGDEDYLVDVNTRPGDDGGIVDESITYYTICIYYTILTREVVKNR